MQTTNKTPSLFYDRNKNGADKRQSQAFKREMQNLDLLFGVQQRRFGAIKLGFSI